jgi:hypothetical protein
VSLSEEQLSAIEARADAASPGPWTSHDTDDGDWIVEIGGDPEASVQPWWFGDMESNSGRDIRNADFVAAARTDVPALCAALRAAWAEGAGAAATARDLLEQNERLRAALIEVSGCSSFARCPHCWDAARAALGRGAGEGAG